MVAIPKIFTDALNITDQSKIKFILDGDKLVLDVINEDNKEEQ